MVKPCFGFIVLIPTFNLSKKNFFVILSGVNMERLHFQIVAAALAFIIVMCIPGINCNTLYPPYQYGMPAPPSLLEGVRQYVGKFGVNLPPNLGIGTRPDKQPHCYRKCKPGYALAPRAGHVPRYNGCGADGFDGLTRALVPTSTWFTDCCNQHDLCYDTCGSNKVDCDIQFQSCMYERCGMTNGYEVLTLRTERRLAPGPYDNCLSEADLIATGPVVGGCLAFQRAQKNSCVCVPFAHY